ncbi:MAG: DUF6081 family protein [Dehalococcoidia bacterium]
MSEVNEERDTGTLEPETRRQELVIGGFGDLFKSNCPWQTAGFALPDGSFWAYREPNATVVAQGHRLKVVAAPLTRSNDRVQILDNAKHMYFTRERVAVPEGGVLTIDVRISALGYGTTPRDLYDGFVSYNLLDFETGTAIDFFVSNDVIATVYARLPFPGVPAPETGDQRYFAIFKELDVPTSAGMPHDYRIDYDQGQNHVRWWVDGTLVNEEENVPDRIGGFTLAMGLMTEKDIVGGKSVSLHGQGLQGEWSETRVTLT